MAVNNICVYRHIRKDTNTVFYIGIGNLKRPYCKRKNTRGKYWYYITNKTDYYVEILQKNLSWENACELEQLLIQEYGRKDLNTGILCNMTNGGDGGYGVIISDETKLKMRNAKINKPSNQCKKIIDISNNMIFNSITEAALYFNIKRTTLNARLSNQNKNKTTLRYLSDE